MIELAMDWSCEIELGVNWLNLSIFCSIGIELWWWLVWSTYGGGAYVLYLWIMWPRRHYLMSCETMWLRRRYFMNYGIIMLLLEYESNVKVFMSQSMSSPSWWYVSLVSYSKALCVLLDVEVWYFLMDYTRLYYEL